MIDCTPAGVPGFVVPEPFEEPPPPPQPESKTDPQTISNASIAHPASLRLAFPFLRGERAKKKTLAQAIPPTAPAILLAMVVEGAVVAMVSVVVAAPLADITDAGANEQVTPAGSVPQENFTVPPYPATGVRVSVVVADCPGATVAVVGEAATLKSGAGTTIDTAFDMLPALRVSPT